MDSGQVRGGWRTAYKGGFVPGSLGDLHAQEMIQMYESGVTLAAIAERFGCSKQRVHQIFEVADPEVQLRVRRRRAADRELAKKQAKAQRRAAAVARGLRCRICDSVIEEPRGRGGRHGQRSGDPLTCSGECAELWVHLRFVVDLEERELHRQRTLRWAFRNPDKVTYSEERLREIQAGAPIERRRRFFVEGSKKHRAACIAVARDYRPVIEALEPHQLEQIRRYLDSGVFAAESRVA